MDGELLAQRGDPATELYVVVIGRVTVCRGPEGGGDMCLENQLVLEEEFMAGVDHQADVVASGKAEVVVCRGDKVKEALGMELRDLVASRQTEMKKTKKNDISMT
eukprot:scaffold293191_cov42-Prasinocladus_malaysianus.AAC.1